MRGKATKPDGVRDRAAADARHAATAGDIVQIVGCGRELRRDDQVGLRVARQLARSVRDGVRVRVSESPGTDLVDDLEGVGLLVVIDSAAAGELLAAGTWVRLDPLDELSAVRLAPLRKPGVSGHWLGVSHALELGRALRLLPQTVWVYVVAGQDFGYGEQLSHAVEGAVEPLVRQIRADVEGWRRARLEHADA
jgi:hydrogenase maturation protease